MYVLTKPNVYVSELSGVFSLFQIVVCQNRRNLSKDKVCGIIGHELTHMFDYCRAKLDFKNLEHLACTEVKCHLLQTILNLLFLCR